MEKASEQNSSDIIEVSESISSQLQTLFSFASLEENHEEKFSDLENYKKIMEQKVSDLEAFNAQAVSEIRKLKETIAHKEDSIVKLQEDVRTRERIISNLNENQDKLQISLHGKDAQTTELQKEIATIKSSMNKNNPSAGTIKVENQDLQFQIRVLSRKIKEFEAELKFRSKLSRNMHREHIKLMGKVAPLEAQVLKLKKNFKRINADLTPMVSFVGSLDDNENVERIQYLGPAKLQRPSKTNPASCSSNETLVTDKFVPKSTIKAGKDKELNAILAIEYPNGNVQRTLKRTPSPTILRGENHVKNILQTIHNQRSPGKAIEMPKDSRKFASTSTSFTANRNQNFMNVMKVLEKKFGLHKEQKAEIKNVNDIGQPCVQVTKPERKDDTESKADETLNTPQL